MSDIASRESNSEKEELSQAPPNSSSKTPSNERTISEEEFYEAIRGLPPSAASATIRSTEGFQNNTLKDIIIFTAKHHKIMGVNSALVYDAVKFFTKGFQLRHADPLELAMRLTTAVLDCWDHITSLVVAIGNAALSIGEAVEYSAIWAMESVTEALRAAMRSIVHLLKSRGFWKWLVVVLL